MSCAARKFLAAGHIMSIQIHPRGEGFGEEDFFHPRKNEKQEKTV